MTPFAERLNAAIDEAWRSPATQGQATASQAVLIQHYRYAPNWDTAVCGFCEVAWPCEAVLSVADRYGVEA